MDCLAEQLDIDDPSFVKDYRVREMTRLGHAAQIRDAYGFVEVTDAAEELARWVDDRAWTTGDGPKALFDGAVLWLREHRVLFPGVSTLARLVARVRDAAMTRLWNTLAVPLTASQAAAPELLLEIPTGTNLGAGTAASGPDPGVGPHDGGRAGSGAIGVGQIELARDVVAAGVHVDQNRLRAETYAARSHRGSA